MRPDGSPARRGKLAEERATAPFEFTLGSFNVLGSQHTGTRG